LGNAIVRSGSAPGLDLVTGTASRQTHDRLSAASPRVFCSGWAGTDAVLHRDLPRSEIRRFLSKTLAVLLSFSLRIPLTGARLNLAGRRDGRRSLLPPFGRIFHCFCRRDYSIIGTDRAG
jgi:hypothetical protein